MLSYLKRRRLEIEDWLRYHPRLRRALCKWKLWRTPERAVAAITQLCAAARLTDDDALERDIQKRIVNAVERLDPRYLDWSDIIPQFRDSRLAKAAILKPCVGPT